MLRRLDHQLPRGVVHAVACQHEVGVVEVCELSLRRRFPPQFLILLELLNINPTAHFEAARQLKLSAEFNNFREINLPLGGGPRRDDQVLLRSNDHYVLKHG